MTSRRRPISRVSTTTGARSETARPRYLLTSAGGGIQIRALPEKESIVVGRGRDCDLVLDDPSISRRHARLVIGESALLSDLGSRNGTHFRGRRLQPEEAQPIGLGESFTLGFVPALLLPMAVGPSLAFAAASQLRIEDPTADDASGILGAVAQAPASVLILGETGVGKEVLAARLHALSGRKGPFVAINCAALSETLLESELFGHEKGAFTGAVQAKEGLLRTTAGGTLLLDEIGEMSPAVQAKMLRALETQSILRLGGVRPLPIDVRFLAATHRDLLAGAEGFRRDLYYRLAGFTLVIPPLRQRKGQILRLANEILAGPPAIAPEAAMALVAHEWPGNVRELRNVVLRARVLARGGPIQVAHILFDAAAQPAAPAAAPDERSRIVAALEACAGNQTRAARALGISRTTLVQKLRLFGIPRPRTQR